ncbi:MAG TPA: efflux RND transporter periplasmic adaptor subunit [Candidatus Aminicenantes bacterium]|nr:efflux RND transporter periplasmic adaptor subunit [Candidatus Aminicenantes bacterium]HRY63965.1 efflux RND transporter periplasmic adaptor subunit [Candidatus Aminicenantes bacterium]HRZ70878.1 efflux RND transporter periplasmic adaptor subunit [Candidatus Aminicenantes bacterium]
MRIPKAVLGGFLVLIFIAAGLYLFVLRKAPAGAAAQGEAGSPPASSPAAPAAAAPGQKAEAAPLPVKVSKAFVGDLIMTLKSPGQAYTEKRVVLKAEVGGIVKNLRAAEGRHVREGDLLVELDDREYRLNLERLEAQRLRYLSELFLERQFSVSEEPPAPSVVDKLTRAQADYDRVSEGFKSGVASQADLEKAQAALELALIEAGRKKDEVQAATKGLTQAEVDVKIARLSLEKTRIRAPFSGIVTDLKLSPNERLDPGRELFTLVDISRIKVKAKVLESEVGKVVAGREVGLRFSAFPDRAFRGRIEAVSPVIDTEDKTCAVYVSMDNPSEEIKPGMHVEVEFPTEIYKDRLLVPQEAVLVRGGRRLVFAVEGDTAKWRYIEVGLENERFAEVLPGKEPGWGVAAGDTIIIEGHGTLAHDTKVSIVS